MNRRSLVALADAIGDVRPDWDQAGILAALSRLDTTWPGTDAALSAHAMTVAAEPSARTPGAITISPAHSPATTPSSAFGSESCYICGRTRTQCEMVREKEIRRGVPDPHHFETKDQAENNRAVLQIDARDRARVELEEARRKIAYQPDEHPEPRRIQEPEQETLTT